ncbi:MAG TPA: hypothetical protein DCE02_06640 [Ruminiclostridium sp.]|uniref:hypothetical protein n=1 Tax=Acetivibrio saccincola TaxID=1677857 RepID=UPI000EE0D8F9|nr:hypothetical protein [Acetivibrio saccincola]NLW26302.1 hypothetical protein [Acetivibrio saccincola]HAA43661.1 hypothetical protein [Ruminiclostridium sp.]
MEDWENGENGWKAPNPHTSDAWASSGNKSLASPNISLSGDGGMIHMYRRDYTGLNISQKSKLQVDVYISDRGSFGGEVQAVLYIVTDKEYSTGKTTIQPGSKHTLILNLNGIPDLYDVSEIGVKFYYPSGSIGQTDFYIDYLRF